MAELDEPNFDLFTAFKLDFLDDGITAADSQSNKIKRILLAFYFVA